MGLTLGLIWLTGIVVYLASAHVDHVLDLLFVMECHAVAEHGAKEKPQSKDAACQADPEELGLE